MLLLVLAITGSFYLLPVVYTPPKFQVPLSPWIPSLGILTSVHLIGQ